MTASILPDTRTQRIAASDSVNDTHVYLYNYIKYVLLLMRESYILTRGGRPPGGGRSPHLRLHGNERQDEQQHRRRLPPARTRHARDLQP